MFKFVALEHIYNESPKFLEFLLKKCQTLQLYRCAFTESFRSPSREAIDQCDLESLYLDNSSVDLSFITKSASLAKLKHLEVEKSILNLPEGVQLQNL